MAEDNVHSIPNNLEPYWMPFTPNRAFKANPRLVKSARGMYYTTIDGQQILDAIAGLWCCNAGHGHPKITEAIQKQAADLDYACAFNLGHGPAFETAARLTEILPPLMDHVFFTNSGSESVDTALKIAIGYHRLRGEGQRTRLIGRERGYHGVNFGGLSVGGMPLNRKMFPLMLPGVDHLRHTYDRAEMAFSKGQPTWGEHLAEDLERLVALHDASTIAAVIVEPVQGSAGVVVPPVNYLQKLRAICDKYGILLIFDEVITAFGRLGKATASEKFGVTPDLITMAKGLTNGAVPMGAVAVSKSVYDTYMQGPKGAIELFHGYTYSAHPLACAAAMASLQVYQSEGMFERATELSPYWQEALHSLKGTRHIVDIRNIGLMGAVELESRSGAPATRVGEVFAKAWDRGVMIRTTGETIALTPSLIIEKTEIDRIVDTIRQCLNEVE